MRTEIPEGMKLTSRAKQILIALEEKGAVVFQGDDGEEDFETVNQLIKIASDVGYEMIGYRTYQARNLLTVKDNPGSGCFILFDSNEIEVS